MKLRRRYSIGLSKILILCSALVFVGGVGFAGYQFLTNRINSLYVEQEIERANRGEPSSMPATTEPDNDAFAKHTVPPEAPRYIFIPKLSVRAIVMPVGITKENKMGAPGNIHHVGWYTQSAKPGYPGAVVVDGHVANWAAKSVFHELKMLQIGDSITIERGDGTKLQYRIIKKQSYPVDNVDMHAVLAPVDNVKQGLNLVTCDGKVVKGNEFDRRLVVFAEQV